MFLCSDHAAIDGNSICETYARSGDSHAKTHGVGLPLVVVRNNESSSSSRFHQRRGLEAHTEHRGALAMHSVQIPHRGPASITRRPYSSRVDTQGGNDLVVHKLCCGCGPAASPSSVFIPPLDSPLPSSKSPVRLLARRTIFDGQLAPQPSSCKLLPS